MDSLFRPTLVLMSGRMLSFFVTFFIPVILVRVFTPGEYGTYKQVFLIFATVNGIGQLGMAESLFYFLPRAPHKGGRYLVNSLLILMGSGLLCWFLLSKESFRISQLLSNVLLAQYLPLIGLYLLLMMASATLEIVMISRNEYTWGAVSYGVSDFVRALLLISPALLFRDLHALLLGAVAFAAIRCGAAVAYFAKKFGREFRPDAQLLRDQLSYALPFEMAVIVDTLQLNFHQYAVSHFFDAATFAIYSVGCLQIPLIDLMASPASNVMMVRMCEEIRDGRSENITTIWHEMTRKLSLVFFPLFGLVLITAHTLITFLFTSTYAASVPIFMIWSLSVPLATLQTDGVLRVYAKTRMIFVLGILRLAFIAGCIYLFLTLFGLLGAVLVTVMAMALGKAFSLFIMKRLMGIGTAHLLPWASLGAIAGVSAVASLAALGVQLTLQLSALPQLCVVGLVYAASYFAMLLGFGLLNPNEKAALTGWFQRLTAEVGAVKEFRSS